MLDYTGGRGGYPPVSFLNIWRARKCGMRGMTVKTISMAQIQLKGHGIFLLEAYTPGQLLLKTGGSSSEALMMSEEILR